MSVYPVYLQRERLCLELKGTPFLGNIKSFLKRRGQRMLPDLGNGQPKPPSPGRPRSWHTQMTGGQDSREEVVERFLAPLRGT